MIINSLTPVAVERRNIFVFLVTVFFSIQVQAFDIVDGKLIGTEGDDEFEFSTFPDDSGITEIDGLGGDNRILGEGGQNTLDFSSIKLTNIHQIDGLGANDTITGSAEDNVIYGGDGNDILNGHQGDDELHGGAGADKYYFYAGHGNDLVVDYGDPDYPDWIFVFGYSHGDLTYTQYLNDLVVSFNGSHDTITLKDWCLGSLNQIEKIVDQTGNFFWINELVTCSSDPTLIELVIVTSSLPNATVLTPYTAQIEVEVSGGVDLNNPILDTLNYSLIDAPAGMGIDQAGVITWTPALEDVGVKTFTVRIDGVNVIPAEKEFTLTVENNNQPPVITTETLPNAVETIAYSFNLTATDPEAGVVAWSLTSAPVGMSIDGLGELTWVNPIWSTESHTVIVRATDELGLFDEKSFTLVVDTLPNSAPQIISTPIVEVLEESLYQYQVVATDAENDLLAYSLTTFPEDMTIDAQAGLVGWTALSELADPVVLENSNCLDFATLEPQADLSVRNVNLATVTDSNTEISATITNRGLVDVTGELTTTVYAVTDNVELALTSESRTGLSSGQAVVLDFSVSLSALDSDQLKVTVELMQGSECQSDNNFALASNVNVSVSDPGNLSDSQQFSISVLDVNSAPILNLPGTYSLVESEALLIQPTVVNNDRGDSFRFHLVDAIPGISIHPYSGALTSDPELLQKGVYEVVVEVVDLGGLIDRKTLILSVEANDTGAGTTPLRFEQAVKNNSINEGVTISGLGGARSLAASPDGLHVYAGGFDDDAVLVFKVDRFDSVLRFVQKVDSSTAADVLMNGVSAITVSPDGRQVYVGTVYDKSINVFDRDSKTGELTFVESLQEDGVDSYGSTIDGLSRFFSYGIDELVFSPDGYFLYAANNWVGHAYFERNKLDGKLRYLGNQNLPASGGMTSFAFSPDGHYAYSASTRTDSIYVYERDSATGELSVVETISEDAELGITGIDNTDSLVLSHDGLFLYGASVSEDAVSVFARDQESGRLQFVEVIVDGSQDALGNDIELFNGVKGMALNYDSTYLYVSSRTDDGVTAFSRDPITGQLTFVDDLRDGENREGRVVDGLNDSQAIAAIPGSQLLVATGMFDDAVALLRNLDAKFESVIEITEPQEDTELNPGDSLGLSARALDTNLGLVSHTIRWNSSLMPDVWTGDSIDVMDLEPGVHQFTASFIDSNLEGISDHVFVTQLLDNHPGDIELALIGQPITEAYIDVLYEYDVDYEYRATPGLEDLVQGVDFSLVNAPVGMSINAETGLIDWTPRADQAGVHEISVKLDLELNWPSNPHWSMSLKYNINVPEAFSNEAPEIISDPNLTAFELTEYTYDVDAEDPDEDVLTYQLTHKPAGMGINAVTGLIQWTPNSKQLGLNHVEVLVKDSKGGEAEQVFDIEVLPFNMPPTITSEAVTHASEALAYLYDVEATDPNSWDQLSFSLDVAPENMVIDALTGRVTWAPTDLYINAPQQLNPLCAAPAIEFGTLEPVLKWRWDEEQVRHAPLVAQLSDDNGDGQINDEDTPDVVFISYDKLEDFSFPGTIRVLSGSDGTAIESFEIPDDRIETYTHLALADIDSDGIVEIVALLYDKTVVAYDHTGGDPIWKSEVIWVKPEDGSSGSAKAESAQWSALALADIDADGDSEVIVGNIVLDATNGQILWKGEGPFRGTQLVTGSTGKQPYISYAFDLLSTSPGLEVIAGASVYSSSGELLWINEEAGDGFTAVADFDNDSSESAGADLEIALVNNGRVWLLDHLGEIVWGPTILTQASGGADGGNGGPPVVADMNGDGYVEIGVAGMHGYYVLDRFGNELWKQPIDDTSSHMTGSSVFDFDGDGRTEVVYSDHYYLRIFDGATGDIRFEIENRNGTAFEYPTIVDVDADGHADILVSSAELPEESRTVGIPDHRGIRVYQDANNSWVPTRSLWNQHSYYVDNINADGSIPSVPQASWPAHNSFRRNLLAGRPQHASIDLALANLQSVLTDESPAISVELKNRGLDSTGATATVAFYHGDPNNGGELLGEVAVGALVSEESKTVLLRDVVIEQLDTDIYAIVSHAGTEVECTEENNQTVSALIKVRVSDKAQANDTQAYLLSVSNANVPPIITSQPITSGEVLKNYRYDVQAEDEDQGDGLRFSLTSAPVGMVIDPYYGRINWTPTSNQVGEFSVVVRVTDLEESFVEQTYLLEVVPSSANQRPYFTNAPAKTVVARNNYTFVPTAMDPEGGPVSISMTSASNGITYDEQTNTISWFPTINGDYYFELVAEDSEGLKRQQAFFIEVIEGSESNQAPIIISEPEQRSIVLGDSYSYEWLVEDPDGDSLNFDLLSSPIGMSIDSSSGIVSWTPTADQLGLHQIQLIADDLQGGTATQAYTLVVHEFGQQENILMIVSSPPLSAAVGVHWDYQIVVNYLGDGDLTYRLDSGPGDMSVDPITGMVTWNPAIVGKIEAQITVEDSYGSSSTQHFYFPVREEPLAFQFVGKPNYFALIDAPYRNPSFLSDNGSGDITYWLGSKPEGMSIDESTGTILWIPTVDDLGSHAVEVFAEEPSLGRASRFYSVTVVESFSFMFETPPPTSGAVGKRYWYGVRASKPESGDVQYELLTAPEGMTINATTGVINWMPSEAGDFNVVIQVSDETSSATQEYQVRIYSDVIRGRNVCEVTE